MFISNIERVILLSIELIENIFYSFSTVAVKIDGKEILLLPIDDLFIWIKTRLKFVE